MALLTIRDQTVTGQTTNELTLDILTEELTVRELIRSRVYQEVQDYNLRRRQQPVFNGLVQPTDTERVLNGFKPRQPRDIDWKAQLEKACAAFEANQILVLVDDRQVESLDEPVTLRAGSSAVFLRLTPLVGG